MDASSLELARGQADELVQEIRTWASLRSKNLGQRRRTAYPNQPPIQLTGVEDRHCLHPLGADRLAVDCSD